MTMLAVGTSSDASEVGMAEVPGSGFMHIQYMEGRIKNWMKWNIIG